MDPLVARQPIFDRSRAVIAYAIRPGPSTGGAESPDVGAKRAIDAAVLSIGLDTVLGTAAGYFPMTRSMLIDEQWSVLPAKRAVLLLPGNLEADQTALDACNAARAAGYHLAGSMVQAPLLDRRDTVIFSLASRRADSCAGQVAALQAEGRQVLATAVRDYETFHAALAAGFDHFEGSFFCTPDTIAAREVPVSRLSLARLIAEINRPELDFDELERLIKQELALSVKLLRYLRSASLGWRHETETIAQALQVLGERGTRKWASLVALTMIGDDKPQELVTTSLVRAQFMEELGHHLPQLRPTDLFLVGLLSSVDALLDQPLSAVLDGMSLSSEVSGALRGDESLLSQCRLLVLSYGEGDWDAVEVQARRTGLSTMLLPDAYSKALGWVRGLQEG